MQELSLNILDIAQNSVSAGALVTQIAITQSAAKNCLTICIEDNGKGMSAAQVQQVTDPFFTTRTTRKVGLGVPFFKMSAEMTGGSFCIDSTPGVGTVVTAQYVMDHIDRAPLGDVCSTVVTLVQGNPDKDFVYTFTTDKGSLCADTREFRQILEGVPLNTPEVLSFIGAFITENTEEIL